MTTKEELKAIRNAEREIYKKMQQTQDWFEGFQEGRQEALDELKELQKAYDLLIAENNRLRKKKKCN
jgi:uridine kinase